MEYFGKILCISKEDLTRDDRPMVGGYQIDDIKAPIMSVSCYDQLVYRKKIRVIRKGVGRGVTALVSVESLPEKYRKRVEEKYGNMRLEILRHWFLVHWVVDDSARTFYTRKSLVLGDNFDLEKQQECVLNASAIQAVLRLMDDVKMQRAVMQGERLCWEEMAGAINFYQAEFGHTLPLSVNRFKKKVLEFKEKGYEALISKKFGNQNTRLVNVKIEKLLVSIAARPNRPWNTSVCDMYNQFVRGE